MKGQMASNAVTVILSPRTCCIRCARPKKMQKQMAINAATVALSPRTCSMRCPVPKKGRSKLQSMRQRSQCHRERAPYDAPPEKKKEQMTINAATVALSPRTCCIRWPAREPNERAHRFGIFLEEAKMLTARTCFGKCREAWWTIAPRKPMQSGGRARTSPPL